MTFRARLKVARRGASRAFDRHDPLTFMNGFFLFTTIVFAILEVGGVDDVARYSLYVALWLLVVYWIMFELLGHVMELEETLAEPHESLRALRERAASLPPMGMLGVLGFTTCL
jgi:hypothetical protein